MALSFATIAAVNSTTSGPTLDVVITAAVGTAVYLVGIADNAGTAGVSSTSATITDAAGNTWTRLRETNCSPGNATSDGTTISIWQSKITSALSASTVTINFSPDTTSKAATGYVVTPGAGEVVNLIAVGAGWTFPNATAYSSGNFDVLNGHTIIGFTGNEATGAPTADSDTTNGSWAGNNSATATTGTTATSQSVQIQRKTVTADGTQSYDTSRGAARDAALNYIVIAAGAAVVAATLDAVTSSATGTLAIAGTASVTLAAVTSTAAGALTLQGTLAGTLGDTTLAATGALAGPLGALAATLDDVTLASTSTLAITGALTATLGAVTLSGAGAGEPLPEVAASIRILVEITWPNDIVTRLWDGSGPVIDSDGEVWRGATILDGLDSIEQALNGEAFTLSMTLSGVRGSNSDTAWMAYSDGNIVGATVRLLIQPCDARDMPVGSPEVKFSGRIDNVIFDDVASDDGVVTSITAEVTNRFTLRRIISGRVLSDIDQKARSAVLNPSAPPDLFCSEVPKMQDRTVTWPRFN